MTQRKTSSSVNPVSVTRLRARQLHVAALSFALLWTSVGWSAQSSAVNKAANNAAKDPVTFIRGLYTRLNHISQKSTDTKALHHRLSGELKQIMDYGELGRRILKKKTWAKLKDSQRSEFIALLSQMVESSYVRRFRPGVAVTIRYEGDAKRKADGRAQVRTHITVKRTQAAVYYSMRPKGSSWRVYDIVVDDVSQLSTYRRVFRKALRKEGWPGLIARMKKSVK